MQGKIMSVTAEIVKDDKGFPILVKLKHKSNRLEAFFDGPKLTLTGSKRSLQDEALKDMLHLIYPAQPKTVLSIPEPLSVQNVIGGRTILFDDMEGLDKWTVEAGAGGKDNTLAYNDSNSLQVNGTLSRYIPAVKRNFDYSVFYYLSGAAFTETQFVVDIHSGRDYRSMILSHLQAGDIWRVVTLGAGWQTIAVVPVEDAFWHKIEIQVREWTYKKVRIDNFEFGIDLSMHRAASAVPVCSTIQFITNIANNFDDLLIREVEP